jgi:hypothetical protein
MAAGVRITVFSTCFFAVVLALSRAGGSGVTDGARPRSDGGAESTGAAIDFGVGLLTRGFTAATRPRGAMASMT